MQEKDTNMEELTIRYLQQDISENELKALDKWLQESPENKEGFFQLKGIYDSTKNHRLLSEEEVEKSWQGMRRKLAAPAGTMPAASNKMFFLVTLKYIAVAVGAIVLGMGIGNYNATRSLPAAEAKVVACNEISVRKGGKPNTIILSDGTKVMLNAAGTLRYPANFSGAVREVYLDGEAYFEVAGNKEKPFIVRLKQQNITVHGTSFNVEAYHNESYQIITLLSGSISLETLNGSGEKISDILLKPGQKAYFDSTAGLVSVEKTDASLANVWIRGEYKFKNEPLGLITKRLENYYDVSIHWDDESLQKIRYTGTFSLDQSIQQVLRIINNDKQFVFQQTGNEIHIKKK
jgi:ferric-dicitrate binding protein FerR (iron transport regulator)